MESRNLLIYILRLAIVPWTRIVHWDRKIDNSYQQKFFKHHKLNEFWRYLRYNQFEICCIGKLGHRVEVYKDKNMVKLDLQGRCSSTTI